MTAPTGGTSGLHTHITSEGYLYKARGKSGVRSHFLVKPSSKTSGYLGFTTPAHLVGKRVRVKLEVIDDESNKEI